MSKWVQQFVEQEHRIVQAGLEPEQWFLPDRVGFTNWITKTFHADQAPCNKKDKECQGKVKISTHGFPLFPHQRFIRDYLQYKSPYRGLLLYHGLGIGKTCASIAAAEILMNQKQVYVMLPASLRSNYISEVKFCGHRYYSPQQHWIHVPLSDLGDLKKLQFVSVALVKKQKGLWVAVDGKPANFDSLSMDQQEQILDQIQSTIETRYSIVHYNGLNTKMIKEMTQDDTVNPFSNAVVIIDEVHNFISRVIGKSVHAGKIYKLLMEAENLKIILLSGTPVINYIHELAYIINLIKGYTKEYEIAYKPVGNKKAPMAEQLVQMVESHPRVNRCAVDLARQVVKVSLVPGYFDRKDGSALVRFGTWMNDRDIIADLKRHMQESGIALNLRYKTMMYTPLPADDKEFYTLFVDMDKHKALNSELFMRRILGSVSFFKSSDLTLYPEIRKQEVVRLPMSDVQFKKYIEVRDDERRRERSQAKRRANMMDGMKTSSVFKAFSRALCNFTFPEGIRRPYPSKLKQLANELDQHEDDGVDAKQEKEWDEAASASGSRKKAAMAAPKDYDGLLNLALNTLKENQQQYLVDELSVYSPKYAALLEKLQETHGTALVYSQFRKVEGLGILRLVLEAHGYAEFKLKKDKKGLWELDMKAADKDKPKYAVFTDDKERTQAIMNIFNSADDEQLAKIPVTLRQQLEDMYGPKAGGEWNIHAKLIKLLMITQSGAEGISLRHVRQVHVLEPYWNQIRIDQVVGRAVRAKSHLMLPKDEQNVDVFKYIATFTPKQLESNITIRKQDRGLTSDEDIASVAERKRQLTDQFLQLLRNASVDCKLNKLENNGAMCFSYPVGTEEDLFGPAVNILNEPLDKTFDEQIEHLELKPVKAQVKNQLYIYIPTTKELYNFEVYASAGVLEFEGYLERVDEHHWKLKTPK